MSGPLLLMVIAAPVGALDVLYFHLWKHRLYRQPSARGETATHLVRGVLFSLGVWLLANHRFAGTWYWGVGALFLLEVGNSLVDVALERRSRGPFGGVSSVENVVHVFGATLAGAVTAWYFVAGWSLREESTALLASERTIPDWLAWQGRATSIGALLLTLLELGLFLRALARSRTSDLR